MLELKDFMPINFLKKEKHNQYYNIKFFVNDNEYQ